MTNEQIIEELKRLRAHNNTVPSEQQAEIDANINNEVEQINDTIEEYNEKIAALEAKIADESNYQYNSENEERDLTIELLEESFENQLEVMDREDAEYKNLQDLATSIFADYNLEIATLNSEISAIERRLRKNDVAVKKNIGIKLTDDELFALNSELEQKRARIQECEEMKAEYVEDLSNYGELITANNRKREVVLAKQESLGKIKEHRASKIDSLDHAKLRNDKDELASLKAGVVALESRKDYITYNPNAEIDRLIAAIEQNKNNENSVVVDNEDLSADNLMPSVDEVKTESEVEDKSQALINAYLAGTEDIENEQENVAEEENLDLAEETNEHDMFVLGDPDLDLEREAEIEEASDILKEKKKEGWFKKNWKKWVAAGLATVALIAALKSCAPKNNVPVPEDITNDNSSQSQTDEDITEEKEKEFNDKYEIPGDNDLEDQRENNENNITPDPDTERTPDPIPEQEFVPEPEIEPTPDPVPDPIPEPEPIVETGRAELEQGESITSIENILNGNINDDTVIEHGDEVGKTIDNAELNDYTDDGNAVVEFEKTEEQPTTSISKEQLIKNLEEFMGGEITFTDEGNQWIDQISNGKTR